MSDEDRSATDGTAVEPVPEEGIGLRERYRDVSLAASRRAHGIAVPTPAAEMSAIAAAAADVDRWDRYGDGGPVTALEDEVARLLGKPAAAMFPSGVMAQQSVLRVWADRTGSSRVALPQLSHLLHHEQDGPAVLNGFRYELLTTGPRVPVVADLDRIPGPLGAVLLELPLRDAGYLLPSWTELADMAAATRERGVPLHLDGARLWESQPHWGRPLDEIAALADSVYVSLYKGLGGLSGAVVAGPEDVVAEARQWRARHGGTLVTMLPSALSGLRGLREELPRMGEYHARAVNLAQRLLPEGITARPYPPHTNQFRLYLPADPESLNRRLIAFMELEDVAVCPPFEPADAPGWAWTEFTVGAASMEWSAAQLCDLLTRSLLG